MITIPDYFLSPDYIKGYTEGYEACKVEMLKALAQLPPALAESSSTSSVKGEDDGE